MGRLLAASPPTSRRWLALVAARAARWAARSQWTPQWPVPWGPLWGALGRGVGHPWGPCWGVVELHVEAEPVLPPSAPTASRKTCPRRCARGGAESGRRRGGPRARRPRRRWRCRGDPRSAGHLERHRGGLGARRHPRRRVEVGVVELASPLTPRRRRWLPRGRRALNGPHSGRFHGVHVGVSLRGSWATLGVHVGGVVELHVEAEPVLHPPAPTALRKTCPRRCTPGGAES